MANSLRYKERDSILYNIDDEYSLDKNEYYLLYNFFVTYSLCGNQSKKKRTFQEYGWHYFARTLGNNDVDDSIYLKDKLSQAINLDNKSNFLFYKKSDNITSMYDSLNLSNGLLNDYFTERAACLITSNSNRYLHLFYRIRNGLAHGKFVLKNENNTKMIIIQDDDQYNVTGRIVVKLDTLLKLIEIIDKNRLIIGNTADEEKELCLV